MRKQAVLLAAFAGAFWVAPAFAVDEVFERSYPLSSNGGFTLSNVNGSVQVEGWEREEVHVRAVKSSRLSPPDAARVRIEVESTPEAVAVHTRYPRDEGLDVTVEYRVRVPARLQRARIETVNGDVRVRSLHAAGELRTVNGDVHVLDGSGAFSARTTNGNLRLELAGLGTDDRRQEPISLETMNGSVVVELPAGTDANLDVASLNGDFHSELPVVMERTAGANRVRARLGRGGATVRIRTVNGAIRVLAARGTV